VNLHPVAKADKLKTGGSYRLPPSCMTGILVIFKNKNIIKYLLLLKSQFPIFWRKGG